MKFLRLYPLLLLAALFTACEEEHVIVPEDTTSHTRTVLVYMAADNSLTSFALEDLEEMRTGMAEVNEPNACLLVYVDDGRTPRLLELRESLKALKGPLANVPEFRRKVQEMVSDEKARAALLSELNLDEK